MELPQPRCKCDPAPIEPGNCLDEIARERREENAGSDPRTTLYFSVGAVELVGHWRTVKASWDEAKNLANQKKHGISFDEAPCLRAGDYLEIFNEGHSQTEERFVAIGVAVRGLIRPRLDSG